MRWCNTDRGEKENLIPPMLLAGLTTTAVRSKKTARTLADTKLEMEIISQCGSGGLEDYRPSRTNMAKLKLEGQLDVFEYSRVTVPESVHMGDPAGGYVEMLKARNSARGHLMALKREASHEGISERAYGEFKLKSERIRHGNVLGSERNRIGKTTRNFMEGGPPEMIRRDDACTCDGESVPGSSLHEN